MRRLLAAEATSNFGSMLSRLAVPWVAALALDATAMQMAWLVVADVAAGAAGSLVVGALVDRSSRRRVMVTTDLVRAALIGAIALLFLAGELRFWMLALQAAANGVLAMAFSVARSAWIADNVPDDALTTRNAQMSAAGSMSESAAFASGGWIYQLLGPLFALLTDSVSFLVSALLLGRLPEVEGQPRKSTPAGRGGKSAYMDGLRLVAASGVLRTLAVSDVLLALNFSMTGALYMLFVSRDLAIATGMQGLIFATGAVGSLVGAWLAPALGRLLGSQTSMSVGLLLGGFGAVLVPLAPDGGWWGIALLAGHQIVGDGGIVIAMIHGRTLRQRFAPRGARGKVDAGLRGIGQMATLVGALGGGWLATQADNRTVLWLAAMLVLVCAPVVWLLFRRWGAEVP
ncbi:MAG: MFS transporter [Pseudomonadales bacterium]|nr:MFS transporter [Pseudomonadales bacterium]MCP5183753.1 MFS transporter [Pseudomonadales bacterium]